MDSKGIGSRPGNKAELNKGKKMFPKFMEKRLALEQNLLAFGKEKENNGMYNILVNSHDVNILLQLKGCVHVCVCVHTDTFSFNLEFYYTKNVFTVV